MRAEARARGAFYTPAALAAEVAALARPEGRRGRVLDPACGDGALLAAVAARLVAAGEGRAAIAGRLAGIDRDGAALVGARERLRGVLGADAAGVRLVRGDALLDDGAVAAAGGTFAAVVANPPFLSVKRRHLDEATRAALRARYRLARGQFDAHALFLERALAALAPGGRWAFVLPRPVLGNEHLAALRALALDEGALDTVLDAGRPFDAAVEAVVWAGGRGRADGGIACGAAPALEVALVRADPLHVLPLGAAGAAVASLADARGRLPALGSLATIERGVEAGKRSAGVVPLAPGLPPVRAGDEVRAFSLAAPRLALAREPGKPAALFAGPKLLVRRVAPTLVAAVDPTDHAVLNTLYVVRAAPGRLHALAAALNAAPSRERFAALAAAGDALFPYVRASQLAALPVPLDAREPHLARLGAKLAKGPDPSAQRELDALCRD